VSELIKNTPAGEDSNQLFREIGLSSDKWILFILNDNQDPGVAYAGTHWSLVLFHPTPRRRFLLFDSAQPDEESKMDWKIREFVERMRTFLLVDVEWEFEVIQPFEQCPKMGWSGDCGVFVVEYISAVLEALNRDSTTPSFNLSHITDEYIERKRVVWKELISKMAEAEKSAGAR